MGKDMKSMDDKPIHNIKTGKIFSRIQDAIDDKETIKGHIIRVDPGTYEENVKVNKELIVESTSGPKDTTVKAANPRDHVFEVSADNVTIKGFTISGAAKVGKAGTYLKSVERCTISNNVCNENYSGIALEHSNSSTISNNICNENYFGILVNNEGSLNNIERASGYNNISNNTCNQNKDSGIKIAWSSSGDTISNNICNKNGAGIDLWRCKNNTIAGNACNENWVGILLDGADCNNISNNTCNQNKDSGIELTGDRNESNTISDNTCNENKYGIRLHSLEAKERNSISNNTCNKDRYKDDLREIPPTVKLYLLSRLEAEIWGELKEEIHKEIVNATPEEYAESRYKDFEELAKEQGCLHERRPARKEIMNGYIENYNRKVGQRKQVAKLHRLQLARLKKLRALGLRARMTEEQRKRIKMEIEKRMLELSEEGLGKKYYVSSSCWEKFVKSIELSEETPAIDNLTRLYDLYGDRWWGFYYDLLGDDRLTKGSSVFRIESKYGCAQYCDYLDSSTVNWFYYASGTIDDLCRLYRLELKELGRLNKDELDAEGALGKLCEQKMEHIALLMLAFQKLERFFSFRCTEGYDIDYDTEREV